MKNTIIYGIAGANQMYRVKAYYCFFKDDVGVSEIGYRISNMRIKYPDIWKIYIVENRDGLRREYKEAVKRNSIESWVVFKDTLEREGLLIANR